MGKRIVITDLPFQLNGHWGSCSEHLVIHGNGSITDTKGHDIGKCIEEPEIIRCKDCLYYDPPHVEDNGERREYKDMPDDAFDELGTGFVNIDYGVNVGGRCLRDYNSGYSDDKRVFVPETNYCGRAVWREESNDSISN